MIVVLPYLIPLPRTETVDPTELAHPTGQFVETSSLTTYVQRMGPDSGETVVLLHGFGGSTENWAATMPALAAANFDVVAIDLKGFGLSDKTFHEDFTHPAQADFLAEVLDQLAIERAIFVGHSMGGSIAAHFQQRFPDRTEALVFVDGGAFHVQGQGRSTGLSNLLNVPPLRRWARHVVARNSNGTTRPWASAYADPNFVTDELLAMHERALLTEDWDLAYLGLIRDSSNNGLPRRTNAAELPILVIWGEQDRWISLRMGRWFTNSLNGATLEVIPNAGHMPMIEQAEVFNAILLDWLGQESGAR